MKTGPLPWKLGETFLLLPAAPAAVIRSGVDRITLPPVHVRQKAPVRHVGRDNAIVLGFRVESRRSAPGLHVAVESTALIAVACLSIGETAIILSQAGIPPADNVNPHE